MKFTLEIELGNDAMRSWSHIRSALWKVTEQTHDINSHDISTSPRPGDGRKILDVNGNTVGRWEVTNA